jgi:putative transposase
MPLRLKRRQHEGEGHFITFSCYNRNPYLNTPTARDTFVSSLESTRKKYSFDVIAYVVMPEHVHLLVGEPIEKSLSTALQALKLSVSKLLAPSPFWLPRYYDFNVITRDKRIEKLKYIHRNPVRRGLVDSPEGWAHSSFRYYKLDEPSPVQITHP